MRWRRRKPREWRVGKKEENSTSAAPWGWCGALCRSSCGNKQALGGRRRCERAPPGTCEHFRWLGSSRTTLDWALNQSEPRTRTDPSRVRLLRRGEGGDSGWSNTSQVPCPREAPWGEKRETRPCRGIWPYGNHGQGRRNKTRGAVDQSAGSLPRQRGRLTVDQQSPQDSTAAAGLT